MQLSNEGFDAIVRNATKNVDSHLHNIHANFQQYCCQHWTDCHYYYCKSHGSSHHMRARYSGFDDTICSLCGHKQHRYMSYSWIRPVLQKQKEFQANQLNSWNQAVLSTTALPIVKTRKEREICNDRIAINTAWKTTSSALLAPQDGPSNCTTVAVATSSQKRPTKWDIAKPTPINTNLR